METLEYEDGTVPQHVANTMVATVPVTFIPRPRLF